MASIQQTAWSVAGQGDSKKFRTRREAEARASARETELRQNVTTPAGKRVTGRQASNYNYKAEITPTKRSPRGKLLRIDALLRHLDLPFDKKLDDLQPDDVHAWRNSSG